MTRGWEDAREAPLPCMLYVYWGTLPKYFHIGARDCTDRVGVSARAFP